MTISTRDAARGHRPAGILLFQALISTLLPAFSLVLAFNLAILPAKADTAPVGKVTSFTLDNGLDVVLIEDHRVPVVTQMVWYKVGAIDDPIGKSGLAHLLEHLMFKSVDPQGGEAQESFAAKMSSLGATDNATTEHDTTFYFQRAPKDALERLMVLEAERMNEIYVPETEILTEREVASAERRTNVDGDAIKLLAEQLNATLYSNQNYGRPTIGWAHEIDTLQPADLLGAHRDFYRPSNAILVIAGDVTPDEVRSLAEATYGKIKDDGAAPVRLQISEPDPIAERRLILEDPRAPQPAFFRSYLVPSYKSGEPGEAESLEVLAHILGGGESSRLHRALVSENRVAIGVGARYQGKNRDSGTFVFFAISPNADSLPVAEERVDRVLAELAENGVTHEELGRSKSALEAKLIIESDNQLTLATRYGQALAVGRTLDDISTVVDRIRAVNKDDVQSAAKTFLIKKRSVTGLLRKPEAEGTTQ